MEALGVPTPVHSVIYWKKPCAMSSNAPMEPAFLTGTNCWRSFAYGSPKPARILHHPRPPSHAPWSGSNLICFGCPSLLSVSRQPTRPYQFLWFHIGPTLLLLGNHASSILVQETSLEIAHTLGMMPLLPPGATDTFSVTVLQPSNPNLVTQNPSLTNS